MSDSQLEKKLRAHEFRKVPDSWKQEILVSVEQETSTRPKRAKERSLLPAWIGELLWPSPVAWGALACVWVIAGAAGLEWDGSPAAHPAPSSPLEQRLARDQRVFLLEELGESGMTVGWTNSRKHRSSEAPDRGHEGALAPARFQHATFEPEEGAVYEI